jgi:hypothetical protein
MENIDPNTDARFLTANGERITDGGSYWDYDLDRVTVVFADTVHLSDPTYAETYHSPWNGWFRVRKNGLPGHTTMNGERLTTIHPFTRERA